MALIAPGMQIRGQTTQTKSTPGGLGEQIEMGASHFCSQARNSSFEAGGRRQEAEEVFLQI